MWFATYIPLSVSWHIWETITLNGNWGYLILVNILKSKQIAYHADLKIKQKFNFLSIDVHQFIDISIVSYFPQIEISPQESEKQIALWWCILKHHIYSTSASALVFVCLYYLVPKINQACIGKYEISKITAKKCGKDYWGFSYHQEFQCQKLLIIIPICISDGQLFQDFLFWK